MASGPTVAKAYVAIIPTTKGAQAEISKGLLPAADAAGKEAGGKTGGGLISSMKGALSKGAGALKSAMGAALAAAPAAATAALAAFTKSSFDAFANFEQLSGGVQAIFDEMDYSRIAKDAQAAYHTMGISANAYMKAMTTTGATFAQTMGDEAGYETAKRGIQAIADLSSGTGQSVEELTEKYKLITRATSQYQTIADQFSGVLPQTSADFLAQAQAAGLLSSEYTSLTEVPVAEYQAAVTDMLEQGVDSMGLLGNAAREADETLSGSFQQMTAAWDNFMVAVASGNMTDITSSTQTLVESISSWVSLALPRIGTIAKGIGPAILEAIKASGLGEGIQNLFSQAMQIDGVREVVDYITGTLAPQIHAVVDPMIAQLQAALPSIVAWLQQAGAWLAQMGQNVASFLAPIITTILSYIPPVLALIGQLVQNVIWPIISGLWTLISTVIWPGLQGLWTAIQPALIALGGLIQLVVGAVLSIASAVLSVVKPAIEAFFNYITPGLQALFSLITMIVGIVSSIVLALWNSVLRPVLSWLFATFQSFATTAISLWTSIVNAVTSVMNRVRSVVSAVVAVVVAVFRTAASTISSRFQALGSTLSSIWSMIRNAASAALNGLVSIASGVVSGISGVMSRVIGAITAPFRAAVATVRSIWNSTIGGFSVSLPDFLGGGGFSIPYLASGGTITSSGAAIVGERGPELLDLPAGARVRPLTGSDAISGGGPTYSVVVGDVDLTDDDQVKRVTREYLEFLARVARPGGAVSAA